MDDQNKADNKRTIRDWLRIIFRRWALCLLGASLFAIVVLLASLWWPVKYTGISKFTRRMDPAAEQLAGSKSESFETRKLTLQNDLAGDKAIERAIEDLGLLRSLPRTSEGRLTAHGELEKQELIKAVKKSTKVEWEVRSDQVDLISVSFTHPDPQLAEDFPNKLVSNYFAWVSKQQIDRLSMSEAFLREQKDKSLRQMEEFTKERIQFEKDHAGAMPQRPGMLEDQIRKIESDLEIVDRQLTIAEQKLNHLKGGVQLAAMAASQPTSMAVFNPEAERIRFQLREAQDELQRRKTVGMLIGGIQSGPMKDAHPKIEEQRNKIAELQRALKEAEENPAESLGPVSRGLAMSPAGDPILDQTLLQIEIDTLKNEKQKLEKWRDEQRAVARDLAPIAQEYERIIRKMRDKEDEMKNWDSRYLGVQMSLAAESANRRTHHDSIQVAQPQYRPSSPPLLVVLGLAFIGGLGFGAGLVFVAHTLDRSISTPDDAGRYFNLPVHGVIGRIVTQHDQKVARFKKWVLTPAICLVVLAAIAAATTSVVLWLEYPDMYKEWKTSPAAFMVSHVSAGKL